MKKASFLVTRGIPGIAAKDEIIKVNDHGLLIGRWLPISQYPKLMKSRHLISDFSASQYSPPTRPPRRPRRWLKNQASVGASQRKEEEPTAPTMRKASFLVIDSIPGIARRGEIIKVSSDRILIGRWLSISKYPKLMESCDSLRRPSSSGVWISKRITPRRNVPATRGGNVRAITFLRPSHVP